MCFVTWDGPFHHGWPILLLVPQMRIKPKQIKCITSISEKSSLSWEETVGHPLRNQRIIAQKKWKIPWTRFTFWHDLLHRKPWHTLTSCIMVIGISFNYSIMSYIIRQYSKGQNGQISKPFFYVPWNFLRKWWFKWIISLMVLIGLAKLIKISHLSFKYTLWYLLQSISRII